MRVAVEFSQASRATYREFREANPSLDISYLQYQNIIYTFNYAYRDHALETGEKVKFPWGIGDFAITKYKPRQIKRHTVTGEDVINLPIDWKKTREQGTLIYHFNHHTEGFKFAWKWFKKSCRFKMSEIWTFKPSRISSRLIRHYINNGFQHNYSEWALTT